ncbi:MAG: hypothetical protein RI932_201 [Pseudomonadota bacterium]|jgi:enoyl-CoA hydratase
MNLSANRIMLPLLDDRLQLEFRAQDKLLLLHFNDNKTRNAMGLETAAALAALSSALFNTQSTHPASTLLKSAQYEVLLLKSGISGVFLSGGDLKAISEFSTQQGEVFTQNMRTFTEFLRSGKLITIAQLAGIAAGGGCEIALACDLRIATSGAARLDLVQARWGVPAGWGMMSDLRRHGVYASERRRSLAVVSQESWNSESLEKLGLLDARFDHEPNPQDASDRWLNDFLSRLNLCPAALKQALMCERPLVPLAELEEFDQKLFRQFWLGEIHKARVADFLHARKTLKKGNDTP